MRLTITDIPGLKDAYEKEKACQKELPPSINMANTNIGWMTALLQFWHDGIITQEEVHEISKLAAIITRELALN